MAFRILLSEDVIYPILEMWFIWVFSDDDNERNHFYHCLGPFFGSFHGRSGSSGSGTGRRKWSQANGVWTIPDLHDIIDDCTDVKDDEVEKSVSGSVIITMK